MRCPTRAAALLASAAAILAPGSTWAAGHGEPGAPIARVVDTSELTGLARWIGELYNANLWLYGLTVVLTMMLMGLVLGFGLDRLLELAGLNLGKLEHDE